MGLNDRDYMRDRTVLPQKKAKEVPFIAKIKFFIWDIKKTIASKFRR